MRLELSDDGKHGVIDQAVFIMYNCARLATLFQHYDEAVSEGLTFKLIADFCQVFKVKDLHVWQFGSVGNVVGRTNEVNQRRAQLVLGWVTVCRWVNHLGM